MNKLKVLTKRNLLEIIRDPLSLVFCLGFPIVMLIIMPLILGGLEYVPNIFEIENYSVGICVFGSCFSALFVAMHISGDKNTEFIKRIRIAPVSHTTYLFSFVLATLPITIIQTVIFLCIGVIFGLPFGLQTLIAVIYLIPSMLFFISAGVLIGSLCKSEKHAGPVSSILISFCGILGGVFMPIEGMGAFTLVANILPFSHTVKIASGVFFNDFACIFPHILWVIGYSLAVWGFIVIISKVKE